jgi:hypothetical protein
MDTDQRPPFSAFQHVSISAFALVISAFHGQAAALGRLPIFLAKPICLLRSHPQPFMSAAGICCLTTDY